MFAQIIRGKVSDPNAVRPVVDRWMKELGPTAKGWLGSTSGITDDNEVFVLVRFESEEAARANSDKPEQGAWWAEMEKVFDGEATFRDSNDVEIEAVGDLDSAGFVQVIVAKSKDLDRSKALTSSLRDGRIALRPDVLGTVAVSFGGGEFAYAMYFTSEQEARAAEQRERPAEVQATMAEIMSLAVGVPEYLNLKTVWLDSPE